VRREILLFRTSIVSRFCDLARLAVSAVNRSRVESRSWQPYCRPSPTAPCHVFGRSASYDRRFVNSKKAALPGRIQHLDKAAAWTPATDGPDVYQVSAFRRAAEIAPAIADLHSQIPKRTLARIDLGECSPKRRTLATIRTALEAGGVEFIPENRGGAGVWLRRAGSISTE
jgi:hypothetical protein